MTLIHQQRTASKFTKFWRVFLAGQEMEDLHPGQTIGAGHGEVDSVSVFRGVTIGVDVGRVEVVFGLYGSGGIANGHDGVRQKLRR